MSWDEDARCRDLDPELFFANRPTFERRAKAVCARCGVRDRCLAFALESRAEYGVWGGLTGRERMALISRR